MSVPVVRLATVGTWPEGCGGAETPGVPVGPHLVPATFALDGDVIHMAVDNKPKRSRALRRLRNIEDNPRVTVLADHYDDDWSRLWWVRADGEARVRTDPEAMVGPISLLVGRYRQYRDNPPEGPVVSIRVHRWTGWAYAAD